MFFDSARIFVQAGRGGKGCNSFYRDKYTRYPIPDGGDGGRGGDVIIRASKNVASLYDFKSRQHFIADSGLHGSSNKKKGRNGSDKVIMVPLGTTVVDSSTNCRLRDLLEEGQELVAAKGGAGGYGSACKEKDNFEGAPGEEKELKLDLKLIADVGLVGFPNSGKSTLISKITRASPKIASYPFTTQAPVLGIAYLGERSFSVADIPGLIEGSHAGRGLGDRFLRHVERTKILVHIIDMAGIDGRSPLDDYKVITKELKFYSQEVFRKPRILVANKMDLPQAQRNLNNFRKAVRARIITISALESKGLKVLLNAIERKLFPHSR